MGDWSITITGVGAHHNSREDDADNIADEFVLRLIRAGQTIRHAEFVSGSSLRIAVNQDRPIKTPHR